LRAKSKWLRNRARSADATDAFSMVRLLRRNVRPEVQFRTGLASVPLLVDHRRDWPNDMIGR